MADYELFLNLAVEMWPAYASNICAFLPLIISGAIENGLMSVVLVSERKDYRFAPS